MYVVRSANLQWMRSASGDTRHPRDTGAEHNTFISNRMPLNSVVNRNTKQQPQMYCAADGAKSLSISASKRSIRRFVITENAPNTFYHFHI